MVDVRHIIKEHGSRGHEAVIEEYGRTGPCARRFASIDYDVRYDSNVEYSADTQGTCPDRQFRN